MASLRWAVCLAALLATSHLASAQLSAGSMSTMERARAAAAAGGSSGSAQESSGTLGSGSSSGSSSSGGSTANSFGTLGGVTGGGSTTGGLIGMSSGSNGNNAGNNNIGSMNGNTNGGGNLIGGNGNSNGNSNLGNKNGNLNGNNNGGLIGGVTGGSGNGNINGNQNTGNQNGNLNGNSNSGNNNGNINGNNNGGSLNGNQNGNSNQGSNNGNANGNGNSGSNNGNGNGNGNQGSGNGNGNGNNNGCAKSGSNTCGGGKSDPVMTGFTGRSFNFFGDVGKTYSLISSMNHQLSARLKLAQMWNHNGTNMDGIGFMYRNYRVLMELTGDTPHVFVNDKELVQKHKKQKHAWRFEDGSAVEMAWDEYTPGVGNAIVVSTDVLKVMIWHTPAGIIDEGGKALEGFINFNITLMSAPENDRMTGIIGDTYERFTVGQEAFNPNSTFWLPEDQAWHGKAPQGDYEMADYWDHKFPTTLFGRNSEAIASRSALETEPVLVGAEQVDSRAGQPQPLRLRRALLAN